MKINFGNRNKFICREDAALVFANISDSLKQGKSFEEWEVKSVAALESEGLIAGYNYTTVGVLTVEFKEKEEEQDILFNIHNYLK